MLGCVRQIDRLVWLLLVRDCMRHLGYVPVFLDGTGVKVGDMAPLLQAREPVCCGPPTPLTRARWRSGSAGGAGTIRSA